MLILRRIIFYSFVLLYAVCCPLIVLYALGYTVKPGTDQGIIKSGLIYFSTAPPGASIFLSNRRASRRTPAILSDLTPGEYPVRVVLKKHKPWTAILPVEAGKATVLERVLLLPEDFKREILSSVAFEDLLSLSENRFFLLTRGKRAEDLLIYDWKEERFWPVLPVAFSIRSAEIRSVFRVEGGSAFILHLGSDEGEQFLWVLPRGKETQVKDISKLLSGKPEQIAWDPEDHRFLFSFEGGYLSRMDMTSEHTEPNFLSAPRGYGLFNRKIYVLTQDPVFARMDLSGKKEKILLDDPVLGQSLFGSEGFYRIRPVTEDLILFLGRKGDLLANRLPYRFVNEGVHGIEPYPKLKRVLVWKENALGILDFSVERDQPRGFETGPKLVWVFKQGKEIEQAFWVYEGSHILFRDQNRVFLLELETYGKPRLNELFSVKEGSSIYYAEDTGEVFYLEEHTGYLSSLEVVPRREILLLPFPERKEERKRSEIGEL